MNEIILIKDGTEDKDGSYVFNEELVKIISSIEFIKNYSN